MSAKTRTNHGAVVPMPVKATCDRVHIGTCPMCGRVKARAEITELNDYPDLYVRWTCCGFAYCADGPDA